VAKSGRRSGPKASASSHDKRDQLIDAAFETVRQEGFAHASARAIAGRGGFNAALIFYYFASVNDLLVAALARSSRTQLERYEAALADVTTLPELVAAVQEQLRDDRESGHIKVLAELIGAGSSDERLREAVLGQVKPWTEFTERTLNRVLGDSGLAGLVPPGQLSFVIVSLFLGMELLGGVAGDDEVVDALFGSAHRLSSLLAPLLPAGAES
jgi:AcrR family transcriptional regulator